jgi:hypothetical protein
MMTLVVIVCCGCATASLLSLFAALVLIVLLFLFPLADCQPASACSIISLRQIVLWTATL